MGTKKIFTLLNGAGVHIEPNTKIIPANVLARTLSAAEVLETIQQQIDAYKQQAIEECELLKQQAQQEGFEQGFAQWSQQLAHLEHEIAAVNRATEKMIIPVALKAAKKIVGREIELSETAVADIIASKLRTVKQSRQVVIHVSPQDLQNVETHRPQLMQVFERLESLSIRPNDELSRGSCIIETEIGIINAQLEKQWQILEQAFKSLST